MDSKDFINNFRNARLNPFSPSSPSSLITRGDIQKRNRTRQTAHSEMDTSKDNGQAQEALPTVPKAPIFKYKNPATDDRVAFWKSFSDEGVMRHYDDLMDILDKTEQMDSLEDIRSYIGQLKDTNMYKILPGVQNWVDDFEAFYYQSQGNDEDFKYDLSYPVDLMRYQTAKAKSAYEDGYRSKPFYTIKMNPIPSPSELLIKIRDSYK